jgi:tetratricopeptide (TPR) repeat protein
MEPPPSSPPPSDLLTGGLQPVFTAQASAPTVGTKVLARRESGLDLEFATVKKLHRDSGDTLTLTLRFEDGFVLNDVPIEAVQQSASTTSTLAAAVAAANHAALVLLASVEDVDIGYDAAVGPMLPTAIEEANSTTTFATALAGKYKEVGNRLFKEGRLAWALRTYVVAVELMQRLGWVSNPSKMFYDLEALRVCIPCFSNAALCALKLHRHELAAQLCESGLRCSPEGEDLIKLLLRSAQSWLERLEHADPERAVALLERAASLPAGGSRPVLELLQRAKQAVKQRQRAADRALFAGKGFGGARLAAGSVAKADARQECDDLLRKGAAALLGTVPAREFVDMAIFEVLEKEPPVKDASAAREACDAALQCARDGGARAEEARALFWLGLVAAELGEWEAASAHFASYFRLEADLRTRDLRTRNGDELVEPPLGTAYARYFAGMALYNQRAVRPAIEQLEAYVAAAATQQDVQLVTRDALGIEVVSNLDKEMRRLRNWVVGSRTQYQARRMLAFLKQRVALDQNALGSEECKTALLEAEEHLHACQSHASDETQRREANEELEMVRTALKEVAKVEAAAGH